MAVLAHLCDHDPGLATEPIGDRARPLLRHLPAAVTPGLAVDSAHRFWLGSVAAERALQRVRNLAQRAPNTRRFHAQAQQILVAPRALLQRIERGTHLRLVTVR